MFDTDFDRYVVPGESIVCEADGFTCYARAVHDEDTQCPEGAPGYESWVEDEWHYTGVAVTVFRHGVQLTGDFTHAIWGVERNYPGDDPAATNPNAYLRDVANELLPDALADAKRMLVKLCAEVTHAA